ncbi:MAG: hypothetical protein IJ514_00790 [Clostridia bacterium]|nr:hypothetical protein [Clostridia bacterium]
MKRKKLKKIVFVCTGNTCRSPMAEAILKKRVARMGLVGLEVCSAGTSVKENDRLNEKTAQTLKDKGFEEIVHTPKQVDGRLIEESLAIVCMTDKQRDILMDMRWQVLREAGEEEIENNVYSFSELAGYEILDPYGRDIDCYHYVFELLSGGMTALIEKLLPPAVQKKFIPKPKTPKQPTAKGKTAAKTTAKTAKKPVAKTASKNSVKKPRKKSANA